MRCDFSIFLGRLGSHGTLGHIKAFGKDFDIEVSRLPSGKTEVAVTSDGHTRRHSLPSSASLPITL